jgi:hypothetical protein
VSFSLPTEAASTLERSVRHSFGRATQPSFTIDKIDLTGVIERTKLSLGQWTREFAVTSIRVSPSDEGRSLIEAGFSEATDTFATWTGLAERYGPAD